MTNGKFVAICKNCGKKGNTVSGTYAGSKPGTTPQVSGKCPAHPSGNPNMPHVAVWERV